MVKYTTVADVCEINKNSFLKKEQWGFINYLDTKNITNNKIDEIKTLYFGIDEIPSRARRKVKTDDIIFSTVRPIQRHFGIIKNLPNNLLVSTGFVVLTPNTKKINPNYLYFYLTQNKIIHYLNSIAEQSTSTYPSIRSSDLKNLEIEVHDLEIQNKIAHILISLEELININTEINLNLENQIQSIFTHWFIQFNFPDDNNEPYFSSKNKMNDSKIGLIPENWEIAHLGDNVTNSLIGSGIDPFEDSKVYIATADVENDTIINSNNTISFEERPSRANMQPLEKSLWFAKMKDSRKLIFVDNYCEDIINNYIFSTGFCGLKCSPENFYYIWAFLLSNKFNQAKNKLCTGTTMQSINNKNIKEIMFVFPDYPILKKFNEIVEPLFNLIYNNKIQNNNLSNLRDTLLPKLMSGEIDVSKVEI